MQNDEFQEEAGVPFAGEYLKRYESFLGKINEVKAWRTNEMTAGKPSSLEDYFRSHGFCPACHGIGIARNERGMGLKAVGWDRQVQLFEKCGLCGGTGESSMGTQSE